MHNLFEIQCFFVVVVFFAVILGRKKLENYCGPTKEEYECVLDGSIIG